MTNAPDILKTLIIYAVIVPVALFVGYMLSNPLDTSTFLESGFIMLVLLFPLLLKWHQPLLILSWNLNAMLFFLPGRPYLWLAMAGISLVITLLQRATGGVKQLISVPPVTWSLALMVVVVVFTAKMTGMGLRTFGSEIYGGHRYFVLLGAIMGYFALSSRRLPPEHAGLYVALFCLSGLTGIITDLTTLLAGSAWQYIYLVFPANSYAQAAMMDVNGEPLRFGGAWCVSFAIFSFMLAKYGIRGIFLAGKPWRWLIFLLAPAYLLFGGFRGFTMFFIMMFALQFYLEGLHRTKLLPIFAVLGIVMLVLVVGLSSHLPGTIQRALAFLPIQIDQQVQREADESLQWRIDMWKAVLPEVPKHLMLGKGYALAVTDFQLLAGSDAAIHKTFDENQIFALSGSYHNGPLSVVMIFGLWGVIAFVWFVAAGVWVLYRNWRYGDPALRTVNLFLLVAFVSRLIFFIVIFGALDDDMVNFAGFLGLGVALNGGVCSPAPAPVRATSKYQAFVGVRAHLQPTVRRQ
jgi:hypothetical protein